MDRWLIAGIGALAFAALLWWRLAPDNAPPTPAASDEPVLADSAPEPPTAGPVAPDAGFPAGESRAGGSDEGLTLSDETSAKAMMFALFMRLEEPMRRWAQTRGLPRTDPNGMLMLDQPYQQYDDEILAALAANGDMWALQLLAERIQRARPAEAMELYRQAAARGSIYAMLRISELAESIAGLSPDFRFENEGEGGLALEQYYSLRDMPVSPAVTAYAWKAVAEMAGLPGFMALTGARLPDEDIAAACDLAGSIYSELLERRARDGLGAYPGDPPPAWFDPSAFDTTSSCEHEQAVQLDFSACQEIRYQESGEEEDVVFFVCDDAG